MASISTTVSVKGFWELINPCGRYLISIARKHIPFPRSAVVHNSPKSCLPVATS